MEPTPDTRTRRQRGRPLRAARRRPPRRAPPRNATAAAAGSQPCGAPRREPSHLMGGTNNRAGQTACAHRPPRPLHAAGRRLGGRRRAGVLLDPIGALRRVDDGGRGGDRRGGFSLCFGSRRKRMHGRAPRPFRRLCALRPPAHAAHLRHGADGDPWDGEPARRRAGGAHRRRAPRSGARALGLLVSPPRAGRSRAARLPHNPPPRERWREVRCGRGTAPLGRARGRWAVLERETDFLRRKSWAARWFFGPRPGGVRLPSAAAAAGGGGGGRGHAPPGPGVSFFVRFRDRAIHAAHRRNSSLVGPAALDHASNVHLKKNRAILGRRPLEQLRHRGRPAPF